MNKKMKKSYFLLLIIMTALGLRPVCAQSTVSTQLNNQMTIIEAAGTTVNESGSNGPNQFTKFISEAIMAASYGLITDEEYQAIHQRILNQLRRKDNEGRYIYRNTFTITEVDNNGTIGANTIGWNGSANNANKIYMLKGNATITALQTINLRGDGTPGIMIFIPVDDDVTTPKVTLGFNPTGTDKAMFTVNGGNLILLGNRGSEKRLAFDGGATYSNNNPANGSEAALRTVTGGDYRTQAAVFYGVQEQTLNGHTYSELGGAYVANSEFRNFYFQKNGVFTVYSRNTSASIAKAKSMGIYNTYFHDNLIGANTVGVAVQLNASLSNGEEQEFFSEFTPTYFTWPAGETKISGLCIGRSSFERNVAKRTSDTNAEALSQQYIRGGVGGADIGGRHGIIQVRVSNTTFSKSFARWYGGSIFWNRGEDGCLLTLDNCTFEYCHGHLGGAVYNEGNISIKGCTFNNNKAICNGSEGDGGGAYGGGAYLAGNNGYEGCGGAIFSRPSNATGEFTVPRGALVLDDCTFRGNHADTDGGAVCAYVDKNSQASEDNKDIYFDLTVNSNTKLYDNTADRCGGAVALTIDPRVVNSTDGYQYVLHTTASLNYGEASGNVANGTNKLSNKYKTVTSDSEPDDELDPWFDEPGDGGGFYIEKTLTTIGTSTTGFTLDGNDSNKNGGGIFVKDATVTFNDGSVVANESAENGGAVYVDGGNFTMHAGTLGTSDKPNKTGSSYNGGGVYVKGGNFTADGGSINYNQAKDGGGVYCQGGSVTVSNGTVVDHNTATNLGGGFYSASGVTVDASTVSNNSSVLGGGFYCASGTTEVRNGSVVTGNTASDHGAGFYVGGGTATITDSEVSKNKADDNGGGVYSNGGAVTIIDAEIESNEAVNGGGVYSNGGNITITGATIKANTANEKGGGIYSGGGTLTFNAGSIISNIASNMGGVGYGGGGYIDGGTLTILGGDINMNRAHCGGGFYINGGTLNLQGGTIGASTPGNYAIMDGGGFYMSGGEANITDGLVQYNSAANNGGGLYMAGTDETHKCVANFSNGTFQSNQAMNGGGIFLSNFAELYMSGASAVINNHAVIGGRGGGIFKQGEDESLLWVSGTQLKITGNYLGNEYSQANRNNAYLHDYGDFITVDSDNSISSNVQIGVSVNVDDVYEDLPTPVIYCEDYTKVTDIFYMLKKPDGDNGIFDDAKKYTAVYTSSPEPFNTNQIFFVSTWASFNEQPVGFSYDNIDSPEDLAYFMTLVNGTNYNSDGPQPNLNGTVTADIDMSGNNWVPIGEYDHNDSELHGADYYYSGTFQGNGHTISGLKTMSLIGYYNYGMFGMTHGATISNVVLADCEFVSGECARMANLIGEMSGGVAENCIVSGTLTPAGSETQQDEDSHKVVVGGLVGEAKDFTEGDVTTSPVIRNCIATAQIDATTKDDGGIYPNQQAYTVGGLVGLTTANTIIENCFSNPEIKHAGSQGEDQTVPENANRYVGGLVGENYGSVKNCYVRLERNNELTATISMFGMFAGYNDGTIDYCYYPELSLRNIKVGSTSTPNQPLILAGSQTTPEHYGQYNAVILPYTYTSYLKDNQVMMDGESAYGTEEATTLLSRLNDWVDDQTGASYSQWMRTKASDVNADYPVLSYDNIISTLNYTVVGSKDGVRLEYDNSFNDIYDRFAAETEPKGCLFVYRTPWSGTISSPVSEFITADNSDNDIKVYVEDGVALLQNADSKLVNTYTCQEFDDASRSWHHISSSLNGNSPIGFSYANYSEYNENPNPCGASIATGSYASFYPQGITMADLDLYCFYETEYHWINFKRRFDSHWHMNDQHQNIAYTNETSLVPGKGYLASFAGRTLLQAGGELTSGDFTIPVTIKAGSLNASASPAIPANEGTELKGYNLLANPYQSYLDLGEFLTVNSGLFSGSSKSGALIPTYAVYDPEKGAYVQGMASTPSRGSYAPTGTLGMHEGFFIVAANSGKAKFTNDMRLDKATSSAKRAEQPAYPLVNLMVADASGDNDIAVVEFGRPQVEGAAKMMNIGANGKVYFHYNGDDCALLYLDDATDHLPVHFDALEDGTYTMTWSTANATFSYLHLIDNMTGMDIDMLTSDGYTFTSNRSDYKSRFKMMFAYTGVEENGAAETETFAFMHDGNLVVNGEGWLEVIDLCGRTIASTKLTNAQNTMSLPQAAQGVYVLKLTSNNMTKVQKIVVE